MYKSCIKKVSSGTCLPETQGKFLILSSNLPLELTLKHRLKASSVAESKCRSFKINMMAHQKDDVGNKLLERT